MLAGMGVANKNLVHALAAKGVVNKGVASLHAISEERIALATNRPTFSPSICPTVQPTMNSALPTPAATYQPTRQVRKVAPKQSTPHHKAVGSPVVRATLTLLDTPLGLMWGIVRVVITSAFPVDHIRFIVMSKAGKPVNVVRAQNGWMGQHTWRVLQSGRSRRAYWPQATQNNSASISGCVLASALATSDVIPTGQHEATDLLLADQLSESELTQLKREGVCLTELMVTRAADGKKFAVRPTCSSFCPSRTASNANGNGNGNAGVVGCGGQVDLYAAHALPAGAHF